MSKNVDKKEMGKSISVKLPSELLQKAKEKSEKTGVSVSFVVRKAIEEWVKTESKEVK